MRTEGILWALILSSLSALAIFGFMLGPNPNPRFFSSLPACQSYAMSISLPPLYFPPATSCLFLLCLFPLGLHELKAATKAGLGEVVRGAQPPKLGLSLFFSFSGLKSQASQVLWKLIPYSPQRPQIKTDQSSPLLSLSSFLKAFMSTLIPEPLNLPLPYFSRASCRHLAVTLRHGGKNVSLCWYLGF